MSDSFMMALRSVHIVAGGVALATFWVPWVVKKGARVHRRAGWVYVVAMAVVSVSALATSGSRMFDATAGDDPDAQFLGLIGVLAASNLSFGVRALRPASSERPSTWDLGVATLFLLAGVLVLTVGVLRALPLWCIFGALAALGGTTQLRYWRRPATTRRDRVLQHLSGMGASCIATVTAFLVVNAENLGLAPYSLVLWLLPGVLGAIALRVAAKRWRQTPIGAERPVSARAHSSS